MKRNTIKQKMLEGKQVVGAEMALGCPMTGELFSVLGFDFVQVDCQHGLWNDSTAFEALHHICLGPATPSVRVPDNDYAAIGRFLDRGALTIVVPMVNSPEEAAKAVQAVRYPPGGSRSSGAAVGHQTYGDDYSTRANEEILLMVQIETLSAAENSEAILGVDGVDGCMIGPVDLGRSMGIDLSKPMNRDRHKTLIYHVRDTCKKVGKLPGIAIDSSKARHYLNEDYLFVLATGDYPLILDGAHDAMQWIKDLTSTN